MIQRVLGGLFWNLPVVGGVGTGYAAGVVGKNPTASTGHLAVTANGATMVLTMLPGWAQIVRDAGASTYDPRILFAESDANDTATVTANATGSTRNDTVCLKVDMATAPTTDGSNLLSFVIIAGAAGGGLSNAPADGNFYLPLANVAVANAATLISQGNVTDKRLSTLILSGGLGGVVKIDEQILAGAASCRIPPGAASFPTGYRNLTVKWKLRGSAASAATGLNLTANGDNGNNYSYQYMSAILSTFGGNGVDLAAFIPMSAIAANTAPANNFGAGTLTIFDYNSATDFKVCHVSGGSRSAAGAGGVQIETQMGFWLSTAAINFLTLTPGAGNISGVVETYAES